MARRIQKDVWAYLELLWTTSNTITLGKAVKELEGFFGVEKSPRKTAVSDYIKLKGLVKGSAISITEHGDDKKQVDRFVIECEDLSVDIKKRFKDIRVSSEEKIEIIVAGRKDVDQLTQLNRMTVALGCKIYALYDEIDLLTAGNGAIENKEIIKTKTSILSKNMNIMGNMSHNLSTLTANQNNLTSQNFALCGITEDDFKQSEQEKRLENIALLGDIAAQETKARYALQQQMLTRQSWISGEKVDLVELLEESVIFDVKQSK